jgi:tetratricopeptide (TPR) repeat protein
MTRIISPIRFGLVLVVFVLGAAGAPAQQPPSYTAEMGTIVDQLEQIQASIEVAFRSDDYIRSLQALRYRIRRLEEAFAQRAEGHRASYFLARAIEDSYLSLIKKMREGNGAPPAEAIDQVSALNQTRIEMLKAAVNAEREGGGEAGWSAVIEAYFDLQDYNRAISMAEQAAQSYPDSAALLDELKEVRLRTEGIRQNLTEAKRLIENKDYRGALRVLDAVSEVAANDKTVAELRSVVEDALAKVNELRTQALAAEEKEDYKEAFRTWSKLLHLEPDNEEALRKIETYKKEFKIVTRRVYRTCPACGGTGDCEVCRGSKVCLVCGGYGRCLQCKGLGYYASRCVHCLCQECKGGGRCTVCSGDGLVYCPQCRGKGYFTTKQSQTCAVCRGTGKSRFSNQACPNCGGTGRVVVSVDKPCPRCGGRKVERCSHCGGTGICPSCNGRGRAETCTVCKGLGRVITECPYCKGTGICLTCDGKGSCRFCKGTGRCSTCTGRKVVLQELEEELLEGEEAGSLTVITEPTGAQVFVDGKQVGTTPYEPKELDKGEHTVRLTKDGYVPLEVGIDANGDAVIEVNVSLIPDELRSLRVLAVGGRRHGVLFKHYTKRDDGSFLASLTVDGKNYWVKNDEYVLGYQAARLERVTKEQYNTRIGATRVVDMSKLILVNRSGQEVTLTLGAPSVVTLYTAKLYDKDYDASWSAREGNRFGGYQVKSINSERVILVDEGGEELILKVK